jgi:hypothetical protein
MTGPYSALAVQSAHLFLGVRTARVFATNNKA